MPCNWELAVFCADLGFWYELLSYIHVEPPRGSFLPSGLSIRDAVRLTRASRRLAGALQIEASTCA